MVGDQALEAGLRAGLSALGLHLQDAQIRHLLDYQALIQKWTRVYNLTAVRDASEMLTHHLLDSLAVVQPLQKQMDALRKQGGAAGPIRLLDVGSGAGLPGVVLAICCPDLQVHCGDTVAKQAAFVQQVAASLRLPNLKGIHARVETLKDTYSVISSRAFASLADFTQWSEQALAQGGIWMAMKGKHPTDEVAALPVGVEVFHVERLQVPGLDAERCILWLRKTPS